MIVQLVGGGEANWKPHLQKKMLIENENKSTGHLMARSLLKELYPTIKILEEVNFPLTNKEWGFFDFFLPLLKIALEVQGGQHYKYNSHFHASYRDFLWQQKRDKEKRLWCKINDIQLIELDARKGTEEWKNQITQPKPT